jgi:hypothetical protein
MAVSSAAKVPTDGLVACNIGRDVTANAGGSWRSRMGVGVMRGIGGSLNAEDDGGGREHFKGRRIGLELTGRRIPDEDLAPFGLSAGGADLV